MKDKQESQAAYDLELSIENAIDAARSCRSGRENALVVTKLEEAQMWANRAFVLLPEVRPDDPNKGKFLNPR